MRQIHRYSLVHRAHVLGLLLIAALLLAAALPAAAQDNERFSPDEQAALEAARAALEQLARADTITAEIAQTTAQTMTVSLLGQTVQLEQTITTSGATTLQRQPEAAFDDMESTVTSTVEQRLIAPGQDETTTVGPMITAIIASESRVYMRVEAPPEFAAILPSGWQEITDDASIFAGMGVIDMPQALAMGRNFMNLTDLTVFDTVLAVDPPDTNDGVTILHLDPAALLDVMSEDQLAAVFGAGEMPFDTAGVFSAIFNDEKTTYTLEVRIAPDGTLQQIGTRLVIDTALPGDLITDPTLEGAEMTLVQDATEYTTIIDLNAPVTITAPNLNDDLTDDLTADQTADGK